MATDVVAGGSAPGPLGRMVQFLRDVRGEMRRVTWPTFEELKKATTVIIIFVSLMGLLIGMMDAFFQFVFVRAVARLF